MGQVPADFKEDIRIMSMKRVQIHKGITMAQTSKEDLVSTGNKFQQRGNFSSNNKKFNGSNGANFSGNNNSKSFSGNFSYRSRNNSFSGNGKSSQFSGNNLFKKDLKMAILTTRMLAHLSVKFVQGGGTLLQTVIIELTTMDNIQVL